MANKQDKRIDQGLANTLVFTVMDDDGDVIDLAGLTGASIVWSFADAATAASPLITKTDTDITINADPTTGMFSVDLDGTDTEQTPGTYYYDAIVEIDTDVWVKGVYGVLEVAATLSVPTP
jgi:hypothetical protein